MDMLTYGAIALVAFAVAWLLVWGVRRYSLRGALIDVPNERSSHTRPTPRGGGLGIVVVTLLGIALWSWFLPAQWATIAAYIIAGLAIAAVSWIDDLRGVSNRLRFGTHLGAAVLVVAAGGWIEQITLPFIGTLMLGWVGLPLTLFWLVGITNAYNFMDGIDGIAGSQAVLTGCGWFGIGVLINNPLLIALGILSSASALGFLGHNWSPAKIFMGDVGSAFLGFTFGWLGVVATRQEPSLILPMIFLLWTFLFDTGYTILRRLQKGENIFAAHRSHLYQRMVIAGQPHARVTVGYALLGMVGVLVAWRWQEAGIYGVLLIIGLAVALWGATCAIEAKGRPSITK